jgi:hypothetical protein
VKPSNGEKVFVRLFSTPPPRSRLSVSLFVKEENRKRGDIFSLDQVEFQKYFSIYRSDNVWLEASYMGRAVTTRQSEHLILLIQIQEGRRYV